MTADARSLPQGVGDTFDFDSQTGVLFVLRAVRAAAISSDDKNKLKDLIFLYSTGGKDESVKKKLADTLAVLGVTPESVLLEVPKANTASKDVSSTPSPIGPGFMNGRLTPVFTPPSTEITVPVASFAPTMQAQKTVVETPKPNVQNNAPIAEPVTTPVEKVAPVNVVVRPIVPMPQSAPVPEVEKVVPVSEANNVEVLKNPQPQTVPQPQTEATPEYVTARMERIRIIKSDINARVGNPVNLVDVDNVLGREYMSALLEAMKLLSSASEQESTTAMERLEAVYQKVLTLLQSQKDIETPVAPVPLVGVPEIVTIQVPTPVQESVATVVEPMVSVSDVPQAGNQTSAVAESGFPIRSKVSEKPNVPLSASNWGESNNSVTSAPVEVVPSVGVKIVVKPPVSAVSNIQAVTESSEPAVVPVTPAYSPEVTPAVSQVEPLRAITELPTADEVSAIEAMGSNPLYTKDVDAGLEQLLSEWSIFKKSGLFGTGPKGREHPLYIKIAPMQVPLILSGRFEGSTQEIKQSITDYMNGWRYEQGIIYEANETFDQYLRRVIRHIIDLQKTKRRS